MIVPKILVLAGSLRAGSFNSRLAALAVKQFALAGADVSRLSLVDYPLPVYDPDFAESAGPPRGAIALRQMITAHHGIFIASPEYSASVTPLLKNAIDWVSRVRERDEQNYAAFKGRVFAIGAAGTGGNGGLRGVMALRQILELGCGALVIPEQILVPRAATAFDDVDNLKDEAQMKALKAMTRWLIDVAAALAVVGR